MEYELSKDFVLQDVCISIPIRSDSPPAILSADGDATFQPRSNTLEWRLPLVDASNNNGSMEFSVLNMDADGVFPILVDFRSPRLCCDIEVEAVELIETNESVR